MTCVHWNGELCCWRICSSWLFSRAFASQFCVDWAVTVWPLVVFVEVTFVCSLLLAPFSFFSRQLPFSIYRNFLPVRWSNQSASCLRFSRRSMTSAATCPCLDLAHVWRGDIRCRTTTRRRSTFGSMLSLIIWQSPDIQSRIARNGKTPCTLSVIGLSYVLALSMGRVCFDTFLLTVEQLSRARATLPFLGFTRFNFRLHSFSLIVTISAPTASNEF